MKLGKLIAVAMAVAPYGASAAESFAGTWKKIGGRGPDTEAIEQHADLFVIKAPRLAMAGEVTETPARLKDGALMISSGVETRTFYIDRTNGHLLTGHGEYVSVK